MRMLFCLMLCALTPGFLCAQGFAKRAVSGARKAVRGASSRPSNLKELHALAARETRAAEAARASTARWTEATGRSLAADPAVAWSPSPALPVYQLDVDGLFQGPDRCVVEDCQYFDEVFVPLGARLSPRERYLIARNNRINMLEKVVWRSRLDYFKKNAVKVARDLDASITYGRVEYMKFIPKDVRVLYVGEAHYSPKIHKEIFNVLEDFRAAHPDKNIYFLTEFFPDTFYLREGSRFPKWLEKAYAGPAAQKALALNMHVGGLENSALVQSMEDPQFLNRYSARLDGVARRNVEWKYTLDRYRERDPDALFIVYAGGGHVDLSGYRNLPDLEREKKSFVLDFDLPHMKPLFKPVFNYLLMPEEDMRPFMKDKHAKFLLRPRTDRYTRLLGFHLSVTVHPVPGQWKKGMFE